MLSLGQAATRRCDVESVSGCGSHREERRGTCKIIRNKKLVGLEAIAARVEAIAIRLEAITTRNKKLVGLEAIATWRFGLKRKGFC